MRSLIVPVLTLAPFLTLVLVPTMPVAAQSVEGRVDKLEGEMRAVQRKVFPGGAGAYLEPQIRPSEPSGVPSPGTPATGVVTDLTARVGSLEGQMATLTGQIEEGQYRLRQLEDSFAAYRKATDAKLATGGSAAPAGGPNGDDTPLARPAAPPVQPGVATARSARAAQVVAIEQPATGDDAEDAYLYGYRLWEAKLYPEAVAQLKTVVAKYPKSRRASYAQNLIGRAYLDDGKPSLASIAFYDNYKKMPDGERAPDSLYFLGQSLMKLKKPADACKVYGELTDVYGGKIDTTLAGRVAAGKTAAKCK